MKISVIVPVYREPKYLADTVKKISADSYADREIIAVVDGEMTREIMAALEQARGKIRVIYSGEHCGKALALNKAVQSIQTDVLFFLDNDVLLPDNPNYLSMLAEKMQKNDIVEMLKEVTVRSIFSAMISYEYLNFAMMCLTLSSVAKRSPGLIGSAFAVKKELFDRLEGFRQVVHEDGDFGARAFRRQTRYFYSVKLKVKTDMPDNLRDWMKQRKRWALINLLWAKENILHLFLNMFKRPALIPAFLFISMPTIGLTSLYFIMDKLKLTAVLPFIYMQLQSVHFISGFLLGFSQFTLFSQGLASVLCGVLISTAIFAAIAHFIKARFNVFEYALFYFIYSPGLVLVNLAIFAAYIIKGEINIDWKVQPEHMQG